MAVRPSADKDKSTLKVGSGALANQEDYLMATDPTSYYYNKFKRTGNTDFNANMWSEAAKRGESDLLIGLLNTRDEMKTSKPLDYTTKARDREFIDDTGIKKTESVSLNPRQYDVLERYRSYGIEDYDTYMLALSVPTLDDENAKARIVNGRNIGEYTDKEWALEVLNSNFTNMENTIIEMNKANISFFQKAGVAIAGAAGTVLSGVYNFGQDVFNLGEGIVNIFANWSEDDDIGSRFLAAFADDPENFIANDVYEMERRYTDLIDARTGEYTSGVWKMLHGVNESLGYMLPSMLIGGLTGIPSTGLFYTGIAGGNIKETVRNANLKGISYKDLNSGEVITNAVIKSAAQWAVEEALGAFLGFTETRKWMRGGKKGLGKVATNTAEAVSKTGWAAFGEFAKGAAKEYAKEGLEEVLQDMSDGFVDFLYSKTSSDTALKSIFGENAQDKFDIGNLVDSFISGALMSAIVGSVTNLKYIGKSNRGVAIDPNTRKSYRMGYFQTLNFNQALEQINSWNDTLNSKYATGNAKMEAAMKMQAAMSALGPLFRGMGIERTIKVNKFFQSYRLNEAKKEYVTKNIIKTPIEYSKQLFNNFTVKYNLLTTAQEAVELDEKSKSKEERLALKQQRIQEAIARKSKTLQDTGTTEVKAVIDKDGVQGPSDVNVTSLRNSLGDLGADNIVVTDGNKVVVDEESNTIFVPSDIYENDDTRQLLVQMSENGITQEMLEVIPKNIMQLATNLYKRLTNNVDVTEEEIVEALLFDKNFYSNVLIEAGKTKMTDRTVNQIAHLDKLLSKGATKAITTGTLSTAAFKALVKKVQQNMREGIVKYATQFANLDISKFSESVIDKETKAKILNDRNVLFTQTVNKVVSNKPFTASDTERLLSLIDFIATGTSPELINELKTKARSPKSIDRIDCMYTLLFIQETNRIDSRKLIYLPVPENVYNNKNNANIKAAEKGLGTTIKDAVNNGIKFTKASDEVNDLSKRYNVLNAADRIAMIREYIYNVSNGELTIDTLGNILKVLDANSFIKDTYINNEEQLANDIVSGTVTSLRDIVKVSSALNDIKIVYDKDGSLVKDVHLEGKAGAFYDYNNKAIIIVKTKNIIDTICHEATHATQYLLYDITTKSKQSIATLGSNENQFTALPSDTKNSIFDWMQKHLPITTKYIADKRITLESFLYFTTEGEIQARSTIADMMFNVGFTYNNDFSRLVAPDGTSWSLSMDSKKETKETTQLTKKDINKYDPDNMLDLMEYGNQVPELRDSKPLWNTEELGKEVINKFNVDPNEAKNTIYKLLGLSKSRAVELKPVDIVNSLIKKNITNETIDKENKKLFKAGKYFFEQMAKGQAEMRKWLTTVEMSLRAAQEVNKPTSAYAPLNSKQIHETGQQKDIQPIVKHTMFKTPNGDPMIFYRAARGSYELAYGNSFRTAGDTGIFLGSVPIGPFIAGTAVFAGYVVDLTEDEVLTIDCLGNSWDAFIPKLSNHTELQTYFDENQFVRTDYLLEIVSNLAVSDANFKNIKAIYLKNIGETNANDWIVDDIILLPGNQDKLTRVTINDNNAFAKAYRKHYYENIQSGATYKEYSDNYQVKDMLDFIEKYTDPDLLDRNLQMTEGDKLIKKSDYVKQYEVEAKGEPARYDSKYKPTTQTEFNFYKLDKVDKVNLIEELMNKDLAYRAKRGLITLDEAKTELAKNNKLIKSYDDVAVSKLATEYARLTNIVTNQLGVEMVDRYFNEDTVTKIKALFGLKSSNPWLSNKDLSEIGSRILTHYLDDGMTSERLAFQRILDNNMTIDEAVSYIGSMSKPVSASQTIKIKEGNKIEKERKLAKARSRFVSNKEADSSLLRNWKQPGVKAIMVAPEIQNFVRQYETEEDENYLQLPKFLRDKIHNGKLTLKDVKHYVATTNNMNDYTFKQIAKHIYNNNELAKITYKDMRALQERLTLLSVMSPLIDFYTNKKFKASEGLDTKAKQMSRGDLLKAIEDIQVAKVKNMIDNLSPEEKKTKGLQYERDFKANMDRVAKGSDEKIRAFYVKLVKDTLSTNNYDADEVVTPEEMLTVYQELSDIAHLDPETEARFRQFAKAGNLVKIVGKNGNTAYVEAEVDTKQLNPLFFNHYNGTIRGLSAITAIAKFNSVMQKDLTLDLNKGTKVKTTGPWNFIEKMKKADVNYDAETDTELLENTVDVGTQISELDRMDKIKVISNSLSEKLANKIKALPAEDRVSLGTQMYLQFQKEMDALADAEDTEIDRMYLESIMKETNTVKNPEIAITDNIDTSSKGLSDRTVNMRIYQLGKLIAKNLAASKTKYNSLPDIIKQNIDLVENSSGYVKFEFNDNYKSLNKEQRRELYEAMSKAGKLLKKKYSEYDIEDLLNRKAKSVARILEAKYKNDINKLQRELKQQEKKTFKEKVDKDYRTTITNREFVIDSNTAPNGLVKTVLNTTWSKQRLSQVKGLTNNEVKDVNSASAFFEENAEILASAQIADIEEAVYFFINAKMDYANESEYKTFAAIKLCFLGYVYGERNGIYSEMNRNLVQSIENALQGEVSAGATLLSLWNKIKDKVNPLQKILSASMEIEGVQLTAEQKKEFFAALESKDIERIRAIQAEIINYVNDHKNSKKSVLHNIETIRGMSMLSSPVTWLRNKVSNVALKRLNKLSSAIGNSLFKSKTAENQLKLKANVTPEIQQYIDKTFLDSKLFDTLVNNISKYSLSDLFKDDFNKKKYGKDGKLIPKDVIYAQMAIKSMYGAYYNQNMFDGKLSFMNSIHQKLMKVMSDDSYVREASIRYFGKILAERNTELVNGEITDSIMNDFAKALGLGMSDYMHTNNIFNEIERSISARSEVGGFVWKSLMPFASASWNWFKAALNMSPAGLVRAIYNINHLEQRIQKMQNLWIEGKSQLSPELAEYLTRRDLGQGVIGTIAWGLGALLAAFGLVKLEDDDYGIPKLKIGDIEIDISSIFGTSSLLAGAAMIQGFNDDGLTWDGFLKGLGNASDVIVDGFPLMQLIELDMYQDNAFSTAWSYLESMALSYIPNGISWLANATYTGTLRKNTIWEKAIAKIPFLANVLERKVDPFTGETHKGLWDIFNRFVPYFSYDYASKNERLTTELGLNKSMLKGQYKINNEKFTVTGKELTKINESYGRWNAEDLSKFYDNKMSVKIKVNNEYKTLTYNQMTTEQRKTAVNTIMSNNAELAKIMAWTSKGYKYYASENMFNNLRARGIVTNVYRGTLGFVKK